MANSLDELREAIDSFPAERRPRIYDSLLGYEVPVRVLLYLRQTYRVMVAVGVDVTAEMFDKMVDIYVKELGTPLIPVASSAPDHCTDDVDPDYAGVVYYLRVGSLVKIGHTLNMRQRLAAYPPDSIVLATEDGGRIAEKLRHGQFAAHIAHGFEWFHPSADLIEHINSLRDEPLKAAELAA